MNCSRVANIELLKQIIIEEGRPMTLREMLPLLNQRNHKRKDITSTQSIGKIIDRGDFERYLYLGKVKPIYYGIPGKRYEICYTKKDNRYYKSEEACILHHIKLYYEKNGRLPHQRIEDKDEQWLAIACSRLKNNDKIDSKTKKKIKDLLAQAQKNNYSKVATATYNYLIEQKNLCSIDAITKYLVGQFPDRKFKKYNLCRILNTDERLDHDTMLNYGLASWNMKKKASINFCSNDYFANPGRKVWVLTLDGPVETIVNKKEKLNDDLLIYTELYPFPFLANHVFCTKDKCVDFAFTDEGKDYLNYL